ncbi:putative transcription factor bZIP family [Medicago truncatula]|uniref:BZIP transcription factor bZIP124 n=1 Tax=Medicago truncatula TaxID=3880 RepID=A0A072VF03_MEDTR|nr:bZIP transcription factor 11 [Medicago truncatula]KEH40186.1 BZIP transcription factor bZIP124 [Medicago truncatula]RHN77507.1 putative transcription factor bZIP family [Medicago truncatula]
MATSSGNSSVSTKSQSYGSEEDLQLLMDQRKRKRKQSNRESARRSRMRKQKHMDDLIAEVERLRNENSEILTRMNMTTQHYLKIEAENCVLRAQMCELNQRLQSLNDIINLINITTTTNGVNYQNNDCFLTISDNCFMNQMNMSYLNQQPIMASADMFMW